ncbi:MAG: bacillithiol biosynthesis cysteine-adding enzyme BshC [Longimicrobiales bacterium]|nr:bacillithiol biosynthesis cysteine-adding enzyme BshC [Longimicrobiales bacterium]
MNAEILIDRPEGNDLAAGVVAGSPEALRYFAHDWRDLAGYRARAGAIDPDDTGWLEAVRAHGEVAERRKEELARRGGFVVTTGQQPGLFSGPLFTIYKALTAVRLAEELEAELERPVVPLFWIAGEDHDWEEAHHTHLVGVDNELHRVEVAEVEGAGRDALWRVELGTAGLNAVARLREILPPTDFSESLFATLEEAYGEGATLPSGFERCMAEYLAPRGVLFVSAHDPALKARSRGILRRAVEEAEAHETALSARARELDGEGLPVQVPILEGGLNLFVDGSSGRERVYRDGTGFALRHSGRRFTREALLTLLDDEPDRVTPNVLLRPVVESAVFPTVAYVAGPGELAYWGELAPLFDALDVPMPVVHPRLGGTVIEGKVRKVLDKFGVTLDQLALPAHELASELARDEMPDEVRAVLGRIRGAIGQGSSELTEAVRALDPTLKGPIGSARGAAFEAFAEAEKKILQAVKREQEIALQQIGKARLHLRPDGRPQERVLNVSYYLARFGPSFLDAVYDAMPNALPSAMTRT